MKRDVVVIGGGLGGLACAAGLARDGRDVLLLEKNPHLGGTSDVFRRGPFTFPMGPLSFSFPDKVNTLLAGLGWEKPLRFRRSHFQMLTPELDVVFSRPLAELEKELVRGFPADAGGLRVVISRLKEIVSALEKADAGGSEPAAPRPQDDVPSAAFLRRHLRHPALVSFLGSQGTDEPEMSLSSLAGMWRVMSETGIWFPERGIQSVPGKLETLCLRHGAELRTGAGVSEIPVEKGRAAGVRVDSGEVIRSEWVVSNADYKKTFLELLPAVSVPPLHLESVRDVPYTGSELCIYLGLDAARVDFSRLRAEHVIFRKSSARRSSENPEDFAARDVEICLWSRSLPEAAPAGKAAVVLRVSFPYGHFDAWRTGDRKRAEGYRAFKTGLARNLIRVAEAALPGLEDSIEVMEVATPLTYRDWGRRTLGSVAGWSWGAGATRGLGGRTLIRTPVERLLACGIYSTAELFWGGVPTALWSGVRAAEIVQTSG